MTLRPALPPPQVKEQLLDFEKSLVLDRRRRALASAAGGESESESERADGAGGGASFPHVIFRGPPGSGKASKGAAAASGTKLRPPFFLPQARRRWRGCSRGCSRASARSRRATSSRRARRERARERESRRERAESASARRD